MMVQLGNFLFRVRNGLFPLAYLLLLVQGRPVSDQDWLMAALGFLVALVGQAIRVVTIGLAYIIRGGRNRRVYAEELVTTGIFAHCRNPLYLGNYIILVGVAIAGNGWLFILLGLPAFLLFYRAIIAAEENFLRHKFGAAYDDYCARVNRLLPRLSGLRETVRSMEFRWSRVIVKEYGSAYAWLLGVQVVLLKHRWDRLGYPAVQTEALALGAGILLVTILYFWARYLKHSGTLKGD